MKSNFRFRALFLAAVVFAGVAQALPPTHEITPGGRYTFSGTTISLHTLHLVRQEREVFRQQNIRQILEAKELKEGELRIVREALPGFRSTTGRLAEALDALHDRIETLERTKRERPLREAEEQELKKLVEAREELLSSTGMRRELFEVVTDPETKEKRMVFKIRPANTAFDRAMTTYAELQRRANVDAVNGGRTPELSDAAKASLATRMVQTILDRYATRRRTDPQIDHVLRQLEAYRNMLINSENGSLRAGRNPDFRTIERTESALASLITSQTRQGANPAEIRSDFEATGPHNVLATARNRNWTPEERAQAEQIMNDPDAYRGLMNLTGAHENILRRLQNVGPREVTREPTPEQRLTAGAGTREWVKLPEIAQRALRNPREMDAFLRDFDGNPEHAGRWERAFRERLTGPEREAYDREKREREEVLQRLCQFCPDLVGTCPVRR